MNKIIYKTTLLSAIYIITNIFSYGFAQRGPDQPGPTEMSPLEEVRLLHNQAVNGDKKAVEKAYSRILLLLEESPSDPLYQAFKGSCLTLKARDAYWPPKKLDFAREGFQTMDQAVALDPSHVEVRFIRAMCGLSVPKFFKRLDEAIEDFNFLIQTYEESNQANQDAAMIYYYAAQAFLKNEEKEVASNLLKKSIKTDPGDHWKSESEKLLKKL